MNDPYLAVVLTQAVVIAWFAFKVYHLNRQVVALRADRDRLLVYRDAWRKVAAGTEDPHA